MANDLMAAFVQTPGFPDCRPKPTCDPRPVCPACGGLECLCRPRFFAGQLLTDEDLNRLDHYIVAKNRMHNRHLFGTGVVCGLEVVCSVCDPAGNGTVVVRPGYALSPCGNDIVVCHDEQVNICDLINRCRPRLPDECLDPRNPNDNECRQGTEDWVLAICYQEKPSRGITALRGGSGASCGCGTPGCTGGCKSSHGGCGCGGAAGCSCGSGMTPSKKMAQPKSLPAQCEPTIICEGYGFAVYAAPKKAVRESDPGELVRRFICCVQPLFERLEKTPPANSSNAVLQKWLVELKDAVAEFLITESLYDCDLAARINAIPLPNEAEGNHNAYLVAWNAAVESIFEIVKSILQKCLCAALLPPCPLPADADCVPIATVTVSRGKCRVKKICDIANRKFLLTFPILEYWLSWLPIFNSGANAGGAGGVVVGGGKKPSLRDLVEALCCKPLRQAREPNNPDGQPVGVAGFVGGAAGAAAPGGAGPFGEILDNALKGGAPVDFGNWLLAAMGNGPAGGKPILPAELANPAQAILIHQVVAPLLQTLSSTQTNANALGQAVADLQATVAKQQKAIEKLLNR
ncbi:MAG: hypothetical protein JWN94_4332 [Betaproteobacteria bacterium]|nr:hypothetical protein [Betaproteobacteria bacterium]